MSPNASSKPPSSCARPPKAWPLGVSGHRERILSDLPFRIVYELLPDEEYPRTVRVLAFKHTAQLWPPSKPGDPR